MDHARHTMAMGELGELGRPGMRYRTQLSPEDEAKFQYFYQRMSETLGLDPNPDDPRHAYDYRGAFQSNAGPGYDYESKEYHWPSEFKDLDHPTIGKALSGPGLSDLMDLPDWYKMHPMMDRWDNPEPIDYGPLEKDGDRLFRTTPGIYTAQAKPDPIEEMLKRAEQGKPVERPGYFGTTETPGVPQQPQAPTQTPPAGESWAEYLRRLIRGR